MNDTPKKKRITATELAACDTRLRELQTKELATVQGAGNGTGLKYKYV